MINHYNLARVAGLGSVMPSLLLSAQQTERIVKDQVQTPPVRDQYAEILKASERLSAGQSVLMKERTPQPAVA